MIVSFLSLISAGFIGTHHHTHFNGMLRIEPRVSCILGKCSNSWTIPSAHLEYVFVTMWMCGCFPLKDNCRNFFFFFFGCEEFLYRSFTFYFRGASWLLPVNKREGTILVISLQIPKLIMWINFTYLLGFSFLRPGFTL